MILLDFVSIAIQLLIVYWLCLQAITIVSRVGASIFSLSSISEKCMRVHVLALHFLILGSISQILSFIGRSWEGLGICNKFGGCISIGLILVIFGSLKRIFVPGFIRDL